MSEHSYDQIKQGLKEGFDAARQYGHYERVPAGRDSQGRPLYREEPGRTVNTEYWDAQLSSYYFRIGR